MEIAVAKFILKFLSARQVIKGTVLEDKICTMLYAPIDEFDSRVYALSVIWARMLALADKTPVALMELSFDCILYKPGVAQLRIKFEESIQSVASVRPTKKSDRQSRAIEERKKYF